MEQMNLQAVMQMPEAAAAEQDKTAKTAEMKRVYNRGGLGLIAEFGIFQQIGSVFMVLAVVAVTVVLVLNNAETIELGFGSFSDAIDMVMNSGVIGWVFLAYAVGMSVGMTVGLLVMRKILTERVPIEKKSLTAGQFVLIALAAYGLWGLGIVLGNFPAFFGVEDQGTMEQLLDGLTYEALPIYLYTVIGAPVFEELVCRKFLIDRLHPFGEGYAMAVTALLFGIIHGNSGQFFLAFLLGALFAMVYMRTGKIIYTMLLHGMINLTASLPQFFGMAGISIDTEFIIGVIVLAVVGWIVIFTVKGALPLNPKGSEVADATRAAWKNAGMILARVIGLVLLVFTDLSTMILSAIASESALPLLKLIPTSLAIITVLLLPKWTRRFENKVPSGEMQQTPETGQET